MKPEELIELYALEEAMNYVKKGLNITDESLDELFTRKLESCELTLDEYKVLQEGYRNPVKKKIEDLPPAPFPWVASAGQGSFK